MSDQSINSYLLYMKKSGISTFLQDHQNYFYKTQNQENISIEKSNKVKINEIIDLNQLLNFINNSNACDLKETASKTVFSDGNPNSKIMLIGEAPGKDEDKLGKPFIGAAGQLLDKMLHSINLNRDKVYITNIIPWRPPENRTPNSEEILQCLPFIQKHIEIIKPKIILLLGGTASKAILTSEIGIMKLRGKWYEYKSLNLEKPISVLATFHPAFLLRSPAFKKDSWEDLKMLKSKIQNEDY